MSPNQIVVMENSSIPNINYMQDWLNLSSFINSCGYSFQYSHLLYRRLLELSPVNRIGLLLFYQDQQISSTCILLLIVNLNLLQPVYTARIQMARRSSIYAVKLYQPYYGCRGTVGQRTTHTTAASSKPLTMSRHPSNFSCWSRSV